MNEDTMFSIPVSVSIHSVQYDTRRELLYRKIVSETFGDNPAFSDAIAELAEQESSSVEIVSEGRLTEEDGRLTVSYDETELTGMAGSTTTLSFDESDPEIVSMMRFGSVSTTLIFEMGKRYLTAYQTEVFPFEICTYTRKVENTLTKDGGVISLDYFVELRGATAEHTVFTCEVRPLSE